MVKTEPTTKTETKLASESVLTLKSNLPLRRIISGGQTGVDQAALAAAKALSLETGGFIPRGFRTESGPRPDLGETYGLKPTPEYSYPPRTKLNVFCSDGTFLFGQASPGINLTQHLCITSIKPHTRIAWLPDMGSLIGFAIFHDQLLDFINIHRIETLNVAGNREEKNPGIYAACFEFLLHTLGEP